MCVSWKKDIPSALAEGKARRRRTLVEVHGDGHYFGGCFAINMKNFLELACSLFCGCSYDIAPA